MALLNQSFIEGGYNKIFELNDILLLITQLIADLPEAPPFVGWKGFHLFNEALHQTACNRGFE
jgi:hypothetical protein